MAELFFRTNRDFPKRPVFENGESNWNDILPTITKQKINRIHSSNDLTPIQASLKSNANYVYRNFLD